MSPLDATSQDLLGQRLVAGGYLTNEQLKEVIRMARVQNKDLDSVLQEQGLVPPEILMTFAMGLDFAG